MQERFRLCCVFVLFCLLDGLFSANAAPLGTTITYQGELLVDGTPADGPYDFEFHLHTDESLDIVPPVTVLDLMVNDGLFSAPLDFGVGPFVGEQLYLEVLVRDSTDVGAGFTPLAPVQPITAAPFALHAEYVALGSIGGMEIVPSEVQVRVIGTCTDEAAIRAINEDGSVVCSVGGNGDITSVTAGEGLIGGGESGDISLALNAQAIWLTEGNGSLPPGSYLGTSDDTPLLLAAEDTPAIRIDPDNTPTSPNITVGSNSNYAETNRDGILVHGGSAMDPNSAYDSFAAIGGGSDNQAGTNDGFDNDPHATVGGGSHNTAGAENSTVSGGRFNQATGHGSTVAGGEQNEATLPWATISGGDENMATQSFATIGGGFSNDANGYGSVIAGGFSNLTDADQATVGGGIQNQAMRPVTTVAGGSNNAAHDQGTSVGGGRNNTAGIAGGTDEGLDATVGGGDSNVASGAKSSVSGGSRNKALGYAATVPGGGLNSAGGDYSFAAGSQAVVRSPTQSGDADGDEHTFVWSGANLLFPSTGPNQFLVNAPGGVGIGENAPAGLMEIAADANQPLRPNLILGAEMDGNGDLVGGIIASDPDFADSNLNFHAERGTNFVIGDSGSFYVRTESGAHRLVAHSFGTVVSRLLVGDGGALSQQALLSVSYPGFQKSHIRLLSSSDFGSTQRAVIETDPNFSNAGLNLRSYDDVLITLDRDATPAIDSHFEVGSEHYGTLFKIGESGVAQLADRLGIGLESPAAPLDIATEQIGSPNLILRSLLTGSNVAAGGIIQSDPDYDDSGLVLDSNKDLYIRLNIDDAGDPGTLFVSHGSDYPMWLNANGDLTITGVLAQGSDRQRKERVASVDARLILDQLLALELSEWSYIDQETRHLGPMAQDFHAAFRLGDSDTSIAAIDADGVAMAAIQGLAAHTEEKVEALRAENDLLQSQLRTLEQRIEELESLIGLSARSIGGAGEVGS